MTSQAGNILKECQATADEHSSNGRQVVSIVVTVLCVVRKLDVYFVASGQEERPENSMSRYTYSPRAQHLQNLHISRQGFSTTANV